MMRISVLNRLAPGRSATELDFAPDAPAPSSEAQELGSLEMRMEAHLVRPPRDPTWRSPRSVSLRHPSHEHCRERCSERFLARRGWCESAPTGGLPAPVASCTLTNRARL